MAMLSGLQELNMALTMGTGGPLRLGEICPALVARLGGPAAAASSEIVSVSVSVCVGRRGVSRLTCGFD